MAETADDKQREALLEAAMDLLGDIAGKLGLFERQRYWHLHQEFIQRKNLPTALREGLNEVETADVKTQTT